MFTNWTWLQIVLATSYLAAGLFFIAAIFQITPVAFRSPAVFAAIGVLILVLGGRFLAVADERANVGPTILLVSTAAGGIAIIYALSQITPAGDARQLVWYGGIGLGALIAGWWFFSDRRFGLATADAQETPQDRDTRWTRDTVLIWCYIGGFGVLLFGIRAVVPAGAAELLFRTLGAGVILSCSSLLAGGLLGFLFGIPRSPAPSKVDTNRPEPAANPTLVPAAATPQRPSFEINTNLEQISDWLTKIIVGLGLVNLRTFPDYLKNLSAYFGTSFGDVPGREAITLALIVLFGVCGFLLAYLLTRLFLTGAFVRALSPGEEIDKEIRNANEGRGASPRTNQPGGILPITPGDFARYAAAAQRVSEVANAVEPEEVRSKVLTLANQYNAIRAAMPFSSERTRRLDGIVASLRVLHKASYWMLPELANSSSPGERVAAVAFLQMQPDPIYIPWLRVRFTQEQPFLMYHAAVALRNAANSLGPEHHDALSAAISRALETLPNSELHTHAILEQALQSIS